MESKPNVKETIFNSPCSEDEYKRGKINGNLICSKTINKDNIIDYRYRPIGNPGSIYFSDLEHVILADKIDNYFRLMEDGLTNIGPPLINYDWVRYQLPKEKIKNIKRYEEDIEYDIKGFNDIKKSLAFTKGIQNRLGEGSVLDMGYEIDPHIIQQITSNINKKRGGKRKSNRKNRKSNRKNRKSNRK